MPYRHLPVHPDLDQLRHQAKELLRAIRNGAPSALADLAEFHPKEVEPAACKLADAQLVLARAYRARSWPRLVLACRLIDAIWENDVEEVRALVTQHPALLTEDALVRPGSNWGPPMSYAANLGRDEIIAMLHAMGARDHEHALGRALLQGQVQTARWLHSAVGKPVISPDQFGGPAYTLNVSGTRLLFELGVSLPVKDGKVDAPVATVMQSDSRRPGAKHEILAMYEAHGYDYPDTPTMALHRGRLDLLQKHLARDPSLLTRTFSYDEIYPPSLGCVGEDLPRTTLDGVTLLHLGIDFDEWEIAQWLFANGQGADAAAALDAQGFGGFSPLFTAIVGYSNFWGNYRGGGASARWVELLLERGAEPNVCASMRERVVNDDVVSWREHRNITAREWGERYHNRTIVSWPGVELLRNLERSPNG